MEVNAATAIANANFTLNNSGWVHFTGGASIAPNEWCYSDYFGPNVEGLVISGGTTFYATRHTFNLKNLDATNGVVAVASGLGINKVLIMGGGNSSGFFRANFPMDISLKKQGAGTLTVDAPSSVPSVTVEGGTLHVKSPFTVTGALTLGAGTVLRIAAKLTVGSIVDNGGSIELADGGEITYTTDSTQRLVGYNKTGGTLVKDGSGTLTVYDPTAFEGDICVRNGTMDFSSARGRTEKYWRLTFTKMGTGSSQNKYVRVAGIPFYPYELRNETISRLTTGDYVNNGLTDAGVGKDPGSLNAGQASFQCTVTYEAGAPATQIGVNRYFRGWFNNDYPHLITPEVDPDTETTLSLAFRLADTAKPVYGYDLINAYGMNRPTSWTLEASTDGVNWTVADERANQVAKNAGWSGFASDDNYTSCAFVLPLTYKVAGIANMPTAVGVQVDQGGTLDFSNVTDGQGVNKLKIDATKGFGTLANAVLSETGTIEVVNVEGKITDYSFPMTLTDVSGTENLEKWSVVVDGVPMPRRTPAFKASATGGTLSFRSPGLFIMVK